MQGRGSIAPAARPPDTDPYKLCKLTEIEIPIVEVPNAAIVARMGQRTPAK
jgi:hypothetical protein